jgi:hypothetical protein
MIYFPMPGLPRIPTKKILVRSIVSEDQKLVACSFEKYYTKQILFPLFFFHRLRTLLFTP